MPLTRIDLDYGRFQKGRNMVKFSTDISLESMAVYTDEIRRYGGVVDTLFALEKVNPSVYRFALVCEMLRKCFSLACREPFDAKVADRFWFCLGFNLLAAHPHDGVDEDVEYFQFNDVEQKIMTDAAAPLFASMEKWANRAMPDDVDWSFYQGADKYILSEMLTRQDVSSEDLSSVTVKRTAEEIVFTRDGDAVEFNNADFKSMLAYVNRKGPPMPTCSEITDETLRDGIKTANYLSNAGVLKYYHRRVRPLYEKAQRCAEFARTVAVGDEFGLDALVAELRERRLDDPWSYRLSEEEAKEIDGRLNKAEALRLERVSAALRTVGPEGESEESNSPECLRQPKKVDKLADACGRLEAVVRCVEDGQRVGFATVLVPLERLVKACLERTEWGLFGCPLYIQAVGFIQKCGGDDCEKGTEDHAAETAWRTFSNTMATYYHFFAKQADGHEIPKFREWLSAHKVATYNCSDTPRAPEAGNYRGVDSEICTGLFDISKQIALECYSEPDILELMYAGVFPPDTIFRSFPKITERNYSIDKCYSELNCSSFVIELDNEDPFDIYQAACEVMMKGLKYANQACDLELPKRDWFRSALEYLAANPKGTASYANQDALTFSRDEAHWIVDQFYPVGKALEAWAEMVHAKGAEIPLAEQIRQDIVAHTIEVSQDEWDVNWWGMLFLQTYTPKQLNTWVFRPTTLLQWINKLPLGRPTARLVDPKTRSAASMERHASLQEILAKANAGGGGTGASRALTLRRNEADAPTPIADAPDHGQNGEPEEDVSQDEWAELAGSLIHWYKITRDGSAIVDLSAPDMSYEYGYVTYRGITETSKLARKALAFFFKKFRDEMQLDAEGNVVVEPKYYKFPEEAKSRQALRQMNKGGDEKSIFDFLKDQFEPKYKTRSKNDEIVNRGGLWRLYAEPTEVWPPEESIERFNNL